MSPGLYRCWENVEDQEGWCRSAHLWSQDEDSRRKGFHVQMMMMMIENHHKDNNVTTILSAYYMLRSLTGCFVLDCFLLIFTQIHKLDIFSNIVYTKTLKLRL